MVNEKITSDTNLPSVRIDRDTDGGITLVVETVNGDGRFFQIFPAGGHWQMRTMRSVPEGNHLELDENGYPIVHQE